VIVRGLSYRQLSGTRPELPQRSLVPIQQRVPALVAID
jgi:hypothetical protein